MCFHYRKLFLGKSGALVEYDIGDAHFPGVMKLGSEDDIRGRFGSEPESFHEQVHKSGYSEGVALSVPVPCFDGVDEEGADCQEGDELKQTEVRVRDYNTQKSKRRCRHR